IPGPVGTFGIEEDDPYPTIAIVGVAPDVPVAARTLPRAATFHKPCVPIQRVIQDKLDDLPQTALVRVVEECLEILQRAVVGMDVGVIRDVIPIVAKRRWKHGLEPKATPPGRFNIGELRREAGEVTHAVGVAVEKRLHMELVEDGILVPQRIARHRLSYFHSRISARSSDLAMMG